MAAIGGILMTSKPPVHPSSPPNDQIDDKVLRRRLQYKYHQRRHRAKQKEKTLTLSHEVQTLLAEIEQLNQQRQKLLVERNCFASRGTDTGVPARVAMEYFRLFEFGMTPHTMQQQHQFLRAVMTEETSGPDYKGVDLICSQWQKFGAFYDYTRYQLQAINVSTLQDSTVVVADSFFSLRGRWDGVVTLYPALRNDTELLQKVINSVIVVPVQYRFEFDSNGIVTWFSADWDLVSALQNACGSSLVDVANILSGANISRTGQIGSSLQDLQQASRPQEDGRGPIDRRHSVDFLLS
ncbi:hypothetical protein PHYBOEH_002080 [Phytophthora boehmeriae]|uniref:BZIP domain-containing protein n=1 Tax=Phytophthora boehmeriae TaxID=109152 RepID=A0A8T1X682_9STRA|nr:hypothetical protein PHYBOEH_002080 [Phytophthora boehmeriae]